MQIESRQQQWGSGFSASTAPHQTKTRISRAYKIIAPRPLLVASGAATDFSSVPCYRHPNHLSRTKLHAHWCRRQYASLAPPCRVSTSFLYFPVVLSFIVSLHVFYVAARLSTFHRFTLFRRCLLRIHHHILDDHHKLHCTHYNTTAILWSTTIAVATSSTAVTLPWCVHDV